MANVGEIKKFKDGTYNRVTEVFDDGTYNAEPIPDQDTGAASFLERLEAGIAEDTPASNLAAWQDIRGVSNVRQADDGSIFVNEDGTWQPVEGSGYGLTEMAGDVADYSGGLINDAGSIGGALYGAGGGPIGMVAGEAAGRSLANAGRAALADYLGVSGGESDVLTQTGNEFVQGAVEGAIGEAGGRTLGKIGEVAKPYIEPVLDKVGEGVRFGASALGSLATAKNPKLTANLLEEGGEELLQRVNAGNQGFFETVEKTKNVASDMYDRASTRYDELIGGLDKAQPAMKGGLQDAMLDIHRKSKIFDDAGEIRTLALVDNSADLNELVDIWPARVNAVETVQDAQDLKSLLGQRLEKSFDNPLSSTLEKHLRRLYKEADNVVRDAAEQQDMLPQWEAAKKAYGERIDAAKKLNKLFPAKDPKRIDRSIHSIENRANRTLLNDLDKMVELEPDLAPWLHDVKLASRASNLDNQIGVMQADRMASDIIGNMSVPNAIGAAVLSRPAFVNPAMVKVGQVSRRIGDTGSSVVGSIADRTPSAQQAIKQATRIGVDDIDPIERKPIGTPQLTLGEIEPRIMEFAKTRYGANYKRGIESGLEPEQAAQNVVYKLLNNGNADKVSKGLGVPKQELTRLLGIEP
ncbi:hypothetical protein [uncultured Paraglaciecola sp.]|uniref:hypothetical protein n=1 Tax=uncultured Paraglaciecola sp. TaxID=1765024 RepID=UPI00262EF89A|nr:hypothetical protein [uncultured Paraglaciecola sp.]